MSSGPTLQFRNGLKVLEVGDCASSLAQALEASLSEASYYGGPWVTAHRDAEMPAWGWLAEVIRRRPGDLPQIGRALQWLVLEGPTGAESQSSEQLVLWRRQALVDLCACQQLSVFLLPWTEPLASLWPTLLGTRSATGWGGNPPEFSKVIAAQHEYLAALSDSVVVDRSGARWASAKLSTDAQPNGLEQLGQLAATTAQRSKSPEALWAAGRWGWLAEGALTRPWIRDAEPQLVERALHAADLAQVAAALQWLGQQMALGRHLALLEACAAQRLAWLATPIRTKPPKWAEPLRVAECADAATWGDVLQRLITLARRDAAVVLRDDLPAFAIA